MTIRITLTPDQERKLEELARRRGKDPSVYVRDVVAAYLDGVGQVGAKTFDAILAPIRDGWQQSGMTEDEVKALFEETRDEVRRARRARQETP
jgi:predicted DNA-binding protein